MLETMWIKGQAEKVRAGIIRVAEATRVVVGKEHVEEERDVRKCVARNLKVSEEKAFDACITEDVQYQRNSVPGKGWLYGYDRFYS